MLKDESFSSQIDNSKFWNVINTWKRKTLETLPFRRAFHNEFFLKVKKFRNALNFEYKCKVGRLSEERGGVKEVHERKFKLSGCTKYAKATNRINLNLVHKLLTALVISAREQCLPYRTCAVDTGGMKKLAPRM